MALFRLKEKTGKDTIRGQLADLGTEEVVYLTLFCLQSGYKDENRDDKDLSFESVAAQIGPADLVPIMKAVGQSAGTAGMEPDESGEGEKKT